MALAGDLVREVMAALRPALGNESPVRAARVGATERAGVRVGTNLIIDTTIGEVEPRPVGSLCPYLPDFPRTVEEHAVVAIGNGGCVLKHAHRQFGVDNDPAYLPNRIALGVLDVNGGCVVGGRRVLRAVARRLRGGCGVARAAEG